MPRKKKNNVQPSEWASDSQSLALKTELPAKWVWTTLGEIRRDTSRSISQEEMRGKTIELYSVPSFATGKPEIVEGDQIGSNKVTVQPGDVLICKINPRINRAWVVGESHGYPQIASTEWIVFSKQDGIIPDYLRYYFSTDTFRNYLAANVSGVGGSLMRVRPIVVERYPFPLAPTAEQERIVAKLDAMLSRIAAGESAARRALERLDCYRATVLHAAVTGELTREWRKTHKPEETGEQLLKRLLVERRKSWEETELQRLISAGKRPKNDKWKERYKEPETPDIQGLPQLPVGWSWASLDQLGELNRGKSKHRPRDDERLYGGSYPFIQTGDIRRSDGTIQEHTQTYSEFGLKQSRLWPAGTLCITIAANIAETGILTYPACFPDSVVGFIQDDTFLRVRFIELFIRSEKQRLEQYAPATAQKNINLDLLRSLAVPLPPLDEQNEILRELLSRQTTEKRLAASNARLSLLANSTRQALFTDAFMGKLVSQDPDEETAVTLLTWITTGRTSSKAHKTSRVSHHARSSVSKRDIEMNPQRSTTIDLTAAWSNIGHEVDAHKLFLAAGYSSDQVVSFYEHLRQSLSICTAFGNASRVPDKAQRKKQASGHQSTSGRFRLVRLWLKDFKNLKNYAIQFDPNQGTDVILGWNGAGKSNLFEALVVIFRDLHYWWEKNRWPDEPVSAYQLIYEIDDFAIRVRWDPDQMRRPELSKARLVKNEVHSAVFKNIKRDELLLPRFIFGYYSGPTNRLAEHFLPMKRDHYERLRKADHDDPRTLADLLEQRRFFCAETHHAKYVLLAFSYKEDERISAFLENRLRIVGFESALFVIRKPRWARPGGTPENFWGATGIMLRVMQKLRQYAIAPMVLEQTVSDGYQSTKEDHFYFFLPDVNRLRAFASEYADARAFFLALESTDFSELIHDVKIQVRVKAEGNELLPITFRELSEGEQQLLTVLGLMRFTKAHQSLVLLDEPDTHLNPHWSVEFLKDLASVVSDKTNISPEQQTSQLLMGTHDPLVIASLLKEQIHLLKRNPESLRCYWEQASINPRGLGFTGILTSDMFGFRSDLDPETLADLDNRVRLVAKSSLSPAERIELESIDRRLAEAGFSKSFSDPYYSAFVRAWGRRYSELMAGQQFLDASQRQEIDAIAGEVLKEAVAEVESEVSK